MGRPGFARAVMGLIGGAILGVVLFNIIRAVFFGLPVVLGGPGVFFIGFGALFGWLWGIGSFLPQSHEHEGLAHVANGKPSRAVVVMSRAVKGTPGVLRSLRPLIPPLLVAIGVCAALVVILMLLSMNPLAPRAVQTDKPEASAVTPAGSIVIGGEGGLTINKTVFFAILAVVVLGGLAITGLILALIFNLLSRGVAEAKQSPPNPPATEPPLFRLIDFVVTWLNDALDGMRRSVTR